jgi:hypothetical protein
VPSVPWLYVVGKKVLRVSEAASERAVGVLRSMVRHAGTPAQAGVMSKLCEESQRRATKTAMRIIGSNARF